jgi:hypothetical protein
MPAMSHKLETRLQSTLGSPVMETAPLSVGFGLSGLVVRLKDGRHLAVKARTGHDGPSLAVEGYMLSELTRLSDLPVPHVHVAEPDLLVMDFIENDGGAITEPESCALDSFLPRCAAHVHGARGVHGMEPAGGTLSAHRAPRRAA